MSGRADVGAVLIGRNEGVRLLACLASLGPAAARSVYVDSGSTDGSVAAARAAGLAVVTLDASVPFTAARARNAGAAALAADPRGAGLAYLQFVDGDCALDPDWVARAAAFLDATPDAAAVCGRRRERFPDASIYNRLCDMEWNTAVGPAAACGGDSLMRRAAFEAVGGFNPGLIAGEEPELCFRLRAAGWTIWRLDAEMTLHDAAITRFGQWWRRAVRGGWAWAEGAAMHGRSAERYKMREARGVLVWGGLVPGAALTLAAAGALGAGAWAWAGAAILAAGLPAMALRTAMGRRRRFGDSLHDALTYGAFAMIAKPAQLAGMLRYARHRLKGGAARLIEYKDA